MKKVLSGIIQIIATIWVLFVITGAAVMVCAFIVNTVKRSDLRLEKENYEFKMLKESHEGCEKMGVKK